MEVSSDLAELAVSADVGIGAWVVLDGHDVLALLPLEPPDRTGALPLACPGLGDGPGLVARGPWHGIAGLVPIVADAEQDREQLPFDVSGGDRGDDLIPQACGEESAEQGPLLDSLRFGRGNPGLRGRAEVVGQDDLSTPAKGGDGIEARLGDPGAGREGEHDLASAIPGDRDPLDASARVRGDVVDEASGHTAPREVQFPIDGYVAEHDWTGVRARLAT